MPTTWPSSLTEHSKTLDPKVIRSFDELIILLSLLVPMKLSRVHHREIEVCHDTHRQWHSFLDNLCWLCDFRSGGKTVASVGVEDTGRGSRFWLATNSENQSKAGKFLKRIIYELHNLATDPHETMSVIRGRIFKKAIKFAHRRVGDYGGKLCYFIQTSRVLLSSRSEGKSSSIVMCDNDIERRCRSAACHESP